MRIPALILALLALLALLVWFGGPARRNLYLACEATGLGCGGVAALHDAAVEGRHLDGLLTRS